VSGAQMVQKGKGEKISGRGSYPSTFRVYVLQASEGG